MGKKELHPISKVQSFVPGRINRGDIKNAPYNPRVIDAHAKRKLEHKLRTDGLLTALTWNKRTGNLLSGHQRLAIIDMIEGNPDYSLDMDIVDLSLRKEKNNNMFFNNPSAQGSWDIILLKAMAEEDGFEVKEAGFDPMDIEVIFDDGGAFGTQPDEGDAGTTVEPPTTRASDPEEDIRKRQETLRRHGKEDEETAKDRIRQDRADSKAKAQDKDDTEFYVIAVFQNRAEREHFMEHINHTKDEKYIDGRELCSLLGINIGR